MKNLLLTTAAALMIAGGAQAASVAANTTLWTSADDPETERQNATDSKSGQSVTFTGNGYEAVVSDVSASGDFIFTGTMRATSDNDTMGIVLGYGDGSNNIRIGWEGGGDADGETSPSSNGLFMIEEIAGTATNLYEDASNFWGRNVDYDFKVEVTGSMVAFQISTGSSLVGSGSGTLAGNANGNFGVYVGSNAATFTNLAYDLNPATVPLPAGLPLLLAGLGGLGLMRRRRKA